MIKLENLDYNINICKPSSRMDSLSELKMNSSRQMHTFEISNDGNKTYVEDITAREAPPTELSNSKSMGRHRINNESYYDKKKLFYK